MLQAFLVHTSCTKYFAICQVASCCVCFGKGGRFSGTQPDVILYLNCWGLFGKRPDVILDFNVWGFFDVFWGTTIAFAQDFMCSIQAP